MFAFASYAKRALRVVLAAAILLPAEVVLLAPQKADAYVAVRRGYYGRRTAVYRGPYGRTAVVHRGPYGRAAAVGEYRPYRAGYRAVYVGGRRFYYNNGVYYRRAVVNGRTTYIVTRP